MHLDGLTVSTLAALVAVTLAILVLALYALRILRRTEDRQLTSLRDIIRLVYHGR